MPSSAKNAGYTSFLSRKKLQSTKKLTTPDPTMQADVKDDNYRDGKMTGYSTVKYKINDLERRLQEIKKNY